MLDIKNQTTETENKKTSKLIKIILAISIPMTVGSLISIVTNTIDTVTISNCVQKAYEGIIIGKKALETEAMRLSGILSNVETIMRMPLAINAAFCTALVPAIASLIAKKDMKTASKRLTFSFFASMLIIMPCAVGLTVIAQPILTMLYPKDPSGAGVLMLTNVTMIFVALNYVVNGGLYGLGKIYVPVIALAIGGVIKTILNIVLISNPAINIYGATISSIVCQGLSFVICLVALNKHIKMDLNFKNHIFKPIFASALMGGVVWIAYKVLIGFFGNSVSTLASIAVGVFAYLLLILVTKCLSKEEIHMIPFGAKLYNLLVKVKLYQ